jgi:hypothetical protein
MVGLRHPSITPGSQMIVGGVDARRTPKAGDKSGRVQRHLRQLLAVSLPEAVRFFSTTLHSVINSSTRCSSTRYLPRESLIALRLMCAAEALAEGAEE